MSAYSLDTDIITKLLKKHPGNQRVVARFREEIERNSLFVVCPIVFYEIRRELVFKGAVAPGQEEPQSLRAARLCATLLGFPCHVARPRQRALAMQCADASYQGLAESPPSMPREKAGRPLLR